MVVDWTIGFVHHVGTCGSSVVVETGLLRKEGCEQSSF